MNEPVNTEDPRRSLADDPDFLSDLADLDRGIGDERSARIKAGASRASSPPAAGALQLPPPARLARPSSPPVPATAEGRPGLDLFSPDMFVPDSRPAVTSSAS